MRLLHNFLASSLLGSIGSSFTVRAEQKRSASAARRTSRLVDVEPDAEVSIDRVPDAGNDQHRRVPARGSKSSSDVTHTLPPAPSTSFTASARQLLQREKKIFEVPMFVSLLC